MILSRNAIGLCWAALLIGCAHGEVELQEQRDVCSDPAGACAHADYPGVATYAAYAAVMSAMPEALQLDLAYKALFDDGLAEIESSSGRKLKFEGGKVIWMGSVAILVAPASNSGSSPDTSGSLGIFYLKPLGENFEVLRRFPFAIDGSLTGRPPEWEISETIANVPVIISTTSEVSPGPNCTITTLTEIWPVAEGRMVSFRSTFDNIGGAPNRDTSHSIKGKIANVRKNISFDVVFMGTRTFSHHYRRERERYVRSSTGAAEELPECQ